MKSVRLCTLVFACFAVAIGSTSPVSAQQDREPMSEAKRQLILQLIDLVNQRTSMDQVADSVMRAMDSVFESSYEQQIRASDEYTAEEKEQLVKDRKRISDKMGARFRERFMKEIDFQKLQQDLMLELYDKYFSEQELTDLVAFYRSATGQKALMVMPELLAESVRRTNDMVGEQVNRISLEVVREVLDEERTKKK
jgi:hypothetical protein